MPKRLILASASPRRKELLSLLGLPFEVVPSAVDEDAITVWPPREAAGALASMKAEAVAMAEYEIDSPDADVLCLGADTIVASERGEREMLAKPRDPDDARRMLRLLSGTSHTVYTG